MPEAVKNILTRFRRKGLRESSASLYYRIYRPLKKRHLRWKYSKGPAVLSDAELLKLFRPGIFNKRGSKTVIEQICGYLDARSAPHFFLEPGDTRVGELMNGHFKEQADAAVSTAEKICLHEFSWLLPGNPSYNGRIGWKKNLRNGKAWENEFFMNIKYSGSERNGDVRELWELNRHQYFITLGKAYYLTGDEKYTAEFLEQMTDWITENPFPYTVNWLHSQETALRMVSWIWAYYFFLRSPLFTADKKIKFLKVLYQHAEFTYHNLSRRVVTHNHIITEVCGLAVFSLMFPEFKRSAMWLGASLKIFYREILKQIWEEGFSAEAASNYHLFVMESILQLWILLRKNNIKIPAVVEDRILNMACFTMYLIRPDGTIPAMGDNDSGRAFRLSEADPQDRRGIIALTAVLFGRGDMKFVSGGCREEVLWLLGSDGFDRFESLVRQKPSESSKFFRQAGLGIFRDGWDGTEEYVVFRGGAAEKRKAVSTSHNHADLLSFEYWYRGKPFFIDPGTYLYNAEDEWRYVFRKTESHNTVAVDSADQFDVTSGRFGVGEIPRIEINAQLSAEKFDYVDMSHYGYIQKGVVHRRSLLFVKKSYTLIIDELIGEGKHIISRHFNFDDLTVAPDGEDNNSVRVIHECSGAREAVRLIQLNHTHIPFRLVKGAEHPPKGWASLKYGEKHAATIAVLSSEVELPALFVSLIIPESLNGYISAELTSDRGVLKVKVQTENFSDTIEFGNSYSVKIRRDDR